MPAHLTTPLTLETLRVRVPVLSKGAPPLSCKFKEPPYTYRSQLNMPYKEFRGTLYQCPTAPTVYSPTVGFCRILQAEQTSTDSRWPKWNDVKGVILPCWFEMELDTGEVIVYQQERTHPLALTTMPPNRKLFHETLLLWWRLWKIVDSKKTGFRRWRRNIQWNLSLWTLYSADLSLFWTVSSGTDWSNSTVINLHIQEPLYSGHFNRVPMCPE